jgi:malonate transporter
VAILRRRPIAEAAVEAQCAVIGNTGFLGVPMLVVLLGEAAAGPVLMVLALDLVVFSTLIVILVTGSREGQVTYRTLGMWAGSLKNPMIVSITLGLIWSATGWTVPGPVNEFLGILGAAATPGALFAIGASLADKSAERLSVAGWLSFCKLVLHPLAVAFAALWLFPVDTFDAAVMIAAASLPVAGNVYILAQHYGVAPQRVSASILISTAISILTVSAVIAGSRTWRDRGRRLTGCGPGPRRATDWRTRGEGAMDTISENRCFGGTQGVYRHRSKATDTDMTFGLFLPEEAEARAGAGAVVPLGPDLHP